MKNEDLTLAHLLRGAFLLLLAIPTFVLALFAAVDVLARVYQLVRAGWILMLCISTCQIWIHRKHLKERYFHYKEKFSKWIGGMYHVPNDLNHTFKQSIAQSMHARTWGEVMRRVYHRIIPHDWRPSEIWYRLKCWGWKRYTTVKPRSLDHRWCDRSQLLPLTMFEILAQFVEKELGGEDLSKSVVNWGENLPREEWDVKFPGHPHRITVNGEEKLVIHEILDLYRWFKDTDGSRITISSGWIRRRRPLRKLGTSSS